jgi:hypothetical protein
MFPKILKRAVQDRVGTSKVIEAFKDTYDYIIGEMWFEAVSYFLCCAGPEANLICVVLSSYEVSAATKLLVLH